MQRTSLKYHITLGTTNIDVSNILDVHRNMVTRWIKENELGNVLEEPSSDSVIINNLKNDSYKKMDELCTHGVLDSKVSKVK